MIHKTWPMSSRGLQLWGTGGSGVYSFQRGCQRWLGYNFTAYRLCIYKVRIQVVCLISILRLSLLSLTIPQPLWACLCGLLHMGCFSLSAHLFFPCYKTSIHFLRPNSYVGLLEAFHLPLPQAKFWRWYYGTVCMVFHTLSTEHQRKINSLPHEL